MQVSEHITQVMDSLDRRQQQELMIAAINLYAERNGLPDALCGMSAVLGWTCKELGKQHRVEEYRELNAVATHLHEAAGRAAMNGWDFGFSGHEGDDDEQRV